MKKYLKHFGLFAMCLSLTMALVACSDDDDDKTISPTDLPELARSFISDHFGETAIQRAVQTSSGEYNVVLQGFDVDFDHSGNWTEIEAFDNTPLPASVLALIPRSIIEYVETNYAGRGIDEIEKKAYGYKIDLFGNPDVNLMFSPQGVFLGKEGDGGNEEIISVDKLPEAAKTFLNTHFANVSVAKVEKDEDSYDVDLAGDIDVEFDMNGNWTKVDVDDKGTIPASVIALLPQNAVTYINANHQSKIVEIEKKVSIYKVELANDTEMAFDLDGQLISSQGGNTGGTSGRIDYENLPQNTKDFMTQHFPSAKVLYVEKDDEDYELTLNDGTKIEFWVSTNPTSGGLITAGGLKEIEVVKSAGVPQSAVKSNIWSHVQATYPGKVIKEYTVMYIGYKVELSGYPKKEVFYNRDGSYKTEVID